MDCKIFIASSAELKQDRDEFRILLSLVNDRLHNKGLYVELEEWENFLNSVSQDSKQGDYNEEIKECDIIVCLFYTKAGKYTQLEFDTALTQFHETGKPLIYTYFKEPEQPVNDSTVASEDQSLKDFKTRLRGLGHFYTRYKSTEDLHLQFRMQLDLLIDKGFLKLQEDRKNDTQDEVNKYIINNVAGRVFARNLIESIKAYNSLADSFISSLPADVKANWETRDSYLKTAKETIISSYSSVLGVKISNLFGCEKPDEYLEVSITIAKRSLQLMCFTFLAALRKYIENNSNANIDSFKETLNVFFEAQVEPDISYYVGLLKGLGDVFQQLQIKYPIPEVVNLQDELKEGAVFFEACKKLNEYAANTSVLPAVSENVSVLTDFLVSLSFLSAYTMMSIKDVSYEEVWLKDTDKGYKNAPQYLHCYTTLGISDDAGQKYQYIDQPLNTEAVLFFRDDYTGAISLFPFVVDKSTLVEGQEENICFYTGCRKTQVIGDFGKKTTKTDIRYFQFKKDSPANDDELDFIIKYDKSLEASLSDITRNNDSRAGFKTQQVYIAFQQVKSVVTGSPA